MHKPFSPDQYRAILTAAINARYRFISFHDAKTWDGTSPACLLRHDCDNDLAAALRMAEIESEFGVMSTYFIMLRSVMYNALSYTSTKIIKRISELGHRLGLHFDEYLASALPPEAIDEEVEFECDVFLRYFGIGVDAVSFHQPGQRILCNSVRISRINTYDPADVGRFDYISDSSGVMRVDFIRMFELAHFPKLHLNLHPEWWQPDADSVLERWQAMLRSSVIQQQQELWERENSFPQRSDVRLNAIGDYRELPSRMVYSKILLDERSDKQ